MEIFLFKVTETYYSDRNGLILLPGLGEKYIGVGTPITIVRPDNTEIETKITSIAFDGNFSITIDKSLRKEDVPIGSRIWARKSLTYDLTHYVLVDKKSSETHFELVFQHKLNQKYFMTLKLSDVAGIRDNIVDVGLCRKLRIDMTGGTYAIDLAIQQQNEAIRKYAEVLIFSDDTCINFCFRGIAKKISFDSITS